LPENILVTGAAGFIGSHIANALIKLGHHVIGYDSLDPQVHPTGEIPSHLSSQVEFIRGDIRDRDTLTSCVARVDVVSHQAAVVGVGQSMYQIEHYVDINTKGTALLLEVLASSKHPVRKLVIPGSMSAYGEGSYSCPRCGPVSPPLRSEDQLRQGEWELTCERCHSILDPLPTPEDKPFQAVSVYAITKQDQEQLSLSVGRAYSIPVVVLRYFNVFGPYQSLDNPYTGVAAIFMSRLKNGHRPVVFEDGRQTRDFISVHDIANANIAAMFSDRADYQALNVGTGRATSVLQLAEMLGTLLGKDLRPETVAKARKGDVRHCSANIGRITQTLGWTPHVTLERGMEELIEWSEAVTAHDHIDSATAELQRRGLLIGS